jgi:hypothetical protein
MVKIAPDKSLPQTKNRGQRLTLTLAQRIRCSHNDEVARGGRRAELRSGCSR